MEKEKKIIWVDGSCRYNPGPGGFAVIEMTKEKQIDYAYSEYFESLFVTNNQMELRAMIFALEYAQKYSNYKYTIYCDSAYVVNICNNWIWTWAKQNWTKSNKKTQIENIDLVKELYSLLKNKTTEIEICKCGGHEGILGNEIADAFATKNASKFSRLIQNDTVFKAYAHFFN